MHNIVLVLLEYNENRIYILYFIDYFSFFEIFNINGIFYIKIFNN